MALSPFPNFFVSVADMLAVCDEDVGKKNGNTDFRLSTVVLGELEG